MNWKSLSFTLVALGISIGATWAIYSYFFPMPDAWAKISKNHEISDVPLLSFSESATVVDYHLKRVSHTRVLVTVKPEGLYLKTSWPRNLFSGPLLITWGNIDACGQTIWCPERDTNFWMDDLKIGISVLDSENTHLKTCRDNGAKILSPTEFRELKYGKRVLSEIQPTNSTEVITKKCS